jgi:hypothetical protein
MKFRKQRFFKIMRTLCWSFSLYHVFHVVFAWSALLKLFQVVEIPTNLTPSHAFRYARVTFLINMNYAFTMVLLVPSIGRATEREFEGSVCRLTDPILCWRDEWRAWRPLIVLSCMSTYIVTQLLRNKSVERYPEGDAVRVYLDCNSSSP